jgi:hypothetical protein
LKKWSTPVTNVFPSRAFSLPVLDQAGKKEKEKEKGAFSLPSIDGLWPSIIKVNSKGGGTYYLEGAGV